MKRSLAAQLIIALILGTIVGAILGPRAEPLGEIGLIIIRLLKALATPLIFFAIVDAFCQTHIPAHKGLKLVLFTTINSVVAIGIALTVANLIPIQKWVNLEKLKASVVPTTQALPGTLPTLSLSSILQGFIPASIVEQFFYKIVIPIIFLDLFIGVALRKIKNAGKNHEIEILEKFISASFKLITVILGWIVHLVPIAAFAVIAKTVGQSGFEVFRALGVFVGLVMLGLVIHVFIYYSLILVFIVRSSPFDFFKKGSEAIITALSTGSSLATLPVTLRTLQDKMKVSQQSARLAACVGTNLNHDGIILYEAVAALFIAQLNGIHMGVTGQAWIGLLSVAAAAGIAGIPEAGFITLSLVVSAVGLPLASVPLLLPVDWFLGRLRAATNVTSDMIVARLLDRT